MTRMMVGPLLVLAASVSPPPAPASPAPQAAAAQPLRATAAATATIRIVSGVRFGERYAAAEVAGADRRSARLTGADGISRPAELLEFQ